MFEFMSLNATKSYTCPLNKLPYVWPTQSTQNVKMVVCLRKRSHSLFSPWLCSKVKKCLSSQLSATVV